MKTFVKLLISGGLVSIFLAACTSTSVETSFDDEVAPDEPSFAEKAFILEEDEHDFGVLKQSGGIVSYDFDFVYQGDEDIRVTGTPASCACTSAKIDKSVFKSGEAGTLTVEFDPNLHEEPKGRFFKTASVLTDPELKEQPEVKIWAEIDLDLGPGAYKLKEHKD